MADDRIEIVLASNERYYLGLLVTAASMARHAEPSAELSFNILDGGLADNSRRELEDCVMRTHPRSQIHFLTIDLARFEELPKLAGSMMTYARLLLPQLLPEVEFALYCDVDFLWHADVGELWSLRDRNCALQSVPETYGPTLERERKWAETHGLNFPSVGYFCAGMCLLNLKMFRDQRLDRQVFDFLARYKDVSYHDQSALNFSLCEERIEVGMLPRKWQVFTHEVAPDDVRGDYALHFAGNTPWAPITVITDAEMLWFHELAYVRDVTTWRALRMLHGPLGIFVGRFVFFCVTVAGLTHTLSGFVLRLLGRPEAIRIFRPLPRTR